LAQFKHSLGIGQLGPPQIMPGNSLMVWTNQGPFSVPTVGNLALKATRV